MSTFHFSAALYAHPGLIRPISSSSGIFFDRIGKLSIVKGNLNVISYVDISYIDPHISNLNEILGTMRFVCQQIDNKQCDNILSPLSIRFKDIKREYESISHLISNRDRRAAWFGAVGSVFKHVFGTLDEDDALKYESALEAVQKDEKILAQLMKENILITTSTLASFKKSINNLKFNEYNLSSALNLLLNHTNNVTKIIDHLTLETKANSIFTNLESSFLTLSFQLEDLSNAISLSRLNILHPRILTPAQLYQELAENNRHLPGDIRIPFSLSLSNIHLILSISTVSCYYYKNKLVFVLHIPLVTTEEFNLYHNFAMPVPHDVEKLNVFSFILPSSSYIAISKDKMSFCNLDDLSKCRAVISEFFLCEISTIVMSSGNPTCESELLTKTISALPNLCQTKTIFGELDIWKPLVNNQWIYVQSRASKITIDCGTAEVREVILLGIGILNVPEQCTVYTKNARLITSKTVINISIPIPSLDFNIINDSCCQIKSVNLKNSASPILLQHLDLDDLNMKNSNERVLSKLNNIIDEKPFIVKYGTHYLTFTSIVFLCLMCFIIFKFYKIIIKSRSKFNIPVVKATPAVDDAHDAITPCEDSPIPLPRLKEIV